MTKTEKLIVSLGVMALGVLFILLQDRFIGILMTVAGITLIAFGLADIFRRRVAQAVVKLVSGVLLIVCGWTLVEGVLYILSAVLLVFGILAVYDKMKRVCARDTVWQRIFSFSLPALAIATGTLLLFQSLIDVGVLLIISGVLLIVAGVLFLLEIFLAE